MTLVWQSLSVFTNAPDDMLRDVIAPCLAGELPGISYSFWERHYVSGTHWRVRIGGTEAAAVEQQIAVLERRCLEYLAHDRSAPEAYDAERVAYLLGRESIPVPDDVARQRHHECVRGPYPDELRIGMAEAAREVADEYRHFACRLCLPLVGDREAAFTAALRAYWLHALLVTGGDLGEGCVSFKSHWSGFAATFEAETVVTRIEAAFAAQSAVLAREVSAVCSWYEQRTTDDAWLQGVASLTSDFMVRTRRRLERGEVLTYQAESVEEQVVRQTMARELIVRPNAFVSLVWDDPRFLASLSASPAFLWARAMTNLLYILISTAGLSALDRQVLCRFAFGAAEELLAENLDRRMEQTRTAIVATALGG